MIGAFVLVRTYSAGVHCGTLAEQSGTAALLRDARRIWRWRGANSLHEMAVGGAAMGWTRISGPVPEILLLQAVEIIPCSDAARKNLQQSRWPKE